MIKLNWTIPGRLHLIWDRRAFYFTVWWRGRRWHVERPTITGWYSHWGGPEYGQDPKEK